MCYLNFNPLKFVAISIFMKIKCIQHYIKHFGTFECPKIENMCTVAHREHGNILGNVIGNKLGNMTGNMGTRHGAWQGAPMRTRERVRERSWGLVDVLCVT